VTVFGIVAVPDDGHDRPEAEGGCAPASQADSPATLKLLDVKSKRLAANQGGGSL